MAQRPFPHVKNRLIRASVLITWICHSLPAAQPVPAEDPGLQAAAVLEQPDANYKIAERGFQGIPGLARAPGGRLWATWYGGGGDEGPDNYVMLVTSRDNGRTWSQFQRVIDPPGLLRTFDPGLWIDPQGED